MMKGFVRKMRASLQGSDVNYEFVLNDELFQVNQYIGKRLSLAFTGNIACLSCGKPTKKSFNQGYCFPCCRKLAACDTCIIKPELCHYHEGTCREPEWGENHCMVPHIVYLSNTSGLKVGITRKSQIPTRWIDQGAIQAIPLYEVNKRYYSGLLEIAIKQTMSDKTNWRKMLKGEVEPMDLEQKAREVQAEGEALITALKKEHPEFEVTTLTEKQTEISYPVSEHPTKIKSVNFDKEPSCTGLLKGIKGQYLIFENLVLNMRKYTSYELEIQVEN